MNDSWWDDILRAIDDEPELPGEMPEGTRRALRDDPELVLRTAVRLTKSGIRERVERLRAQKDGRE